MYKRGAYKHCIRKKPKKRGNFELPLLVDNCRSVSLN